MRSLSALARVLADIIRLTIVAPIRSGLPRTSTWPPGLRPILIVTLLVYAGLALMVIFATPLRQHTTLLMMSRGGLIPEPGAMLLIGTCIFALSLLLTAALHLAWWIKLLAFTMLATTVLYFLATAAGDVPAALLILASLITVVVMIISRWRRPYAWWEFVVIAVAVGIAVLAPAATSDSVRGLNFDWRGAALEATLQTMTSMALPALFVAGAALAQIAVTASFATVSSVVREVPRTMLWVLGALLVVAAIASLVAELRNPDRSPDGWLGATIVLSAIALFAFLATRIAGRPAAWSDLDEDSTTINYAVAVVATSLVLLGTTVYPLREAARVLSIDWLYMITDGYAFIARQDAAVSAVRALAGGVGFLLALPLARRGRPWAAIFLAGIFVLASFDLARTATQFTPASPTTHLAGLLIVAVLLTGVVLWLAGRLGREGLAALACGLLLCVVYPHRAILDDPVSAALGFTGLGAVLFGLIWRLLTEGEITRGDTKSWPMPARVLLYCASALFAASSMSFVAMTRASGGDADIAIYADAGDHLLGTPLFLAAVLGCLGIALARRPHVGSASIRGRVPQ